MVKEETLFGNRQWAALKQRDVFGLDRSKLLEQIMKILGYFSILSCHKTKDFAKPEQMLLQRTDMSCCCIVILSSIFLALFL